MKRVIAVILAVMMLGVVTNCVADTRADVAEMTADFCKEMLVGLLDTYYIVGDALDEDYVELIYRYWKAYNALNDLHRKELQFNIKENPLGAGKVFGVNKELEAGLIEINNACDNKWYDYVNGTITKGEYLEWMNTMIRAITGTN